jgi:VWFA-related protein
MRAPVALLSLAVLLHGQEPAEPVIRTQVNVVVAPTTVVDDDGRLVNGLQPHQFRLFDNTKQQDIKVDVAFQPISLVVAVQANSTAEPVLAKIQKIGPLFDALVTGEQGEVAVVCFDHRIRVLQDFTSDSAKIKEAFTKLTPGSQTSRMVDAVNDATRMLSKRPKDRRRVLLIISETRDRGSEGRKKDALIATEMANVLVYSVNMNRLVNTIAQKSTPPPRPDHIPPSARHTPAGGASTPTTTMQNSGYGNTMPVFVEIFRSVKDIFVDNPVELFTKYSGGREYSFLTQRNLEEAVSQIGEELHSQYLISYNPNNKLEGGWHSIRVEIAGRANLTVRTRTGYWLAGVPE